MTLIRAIDLTLTIVALCVGTPLLLSGVVVAEATHLSSAIVGAPWFCHDTDCPNFKVKEETEDYELRRYDPAWWVETQVDDMTYELAVTTGYAKLMRYFQGYNDDGETLVTTTPTRVKVYEKEGGSATQQNYTVQFYIPEKYQNSSSSGDGGKGGKGGKGQPPKPSDETVHLTYDEELTVYERSVGGFATEIVFLEQRNNLRHLLQDAEQPFEPVYFYTAVYDPPTRLFNRHNEVFVPQPKDEKRGGHGKKHGGHGGHGKHEGKGKGKGHHHGNAAST